jgi:excisionase family DNA binding protein
MRSLAEKDPETNTALLDRAQAAAYLSTSERHIARLWAERRISAVKVGGLVRWRREDLDSYIASRTVEAVR